jgi:hypothetical protein
MLLNPEIGIGRELVTPGGIKLFDSAIEAKDALLNQVLVLVLIKSTLPLLGYCHRQAEIGFQQSVTSTEAASFDVWWCVVWSCWIVHPSADFLGQCKLPGRRQQWCSAIALQQGIKT